MRRLEGIAFQVVDIIDAMETDSGVPLKELRVDGGAARIICSCRSRRICWAFRSTAIEPGNNCARRYLPGGLAVGYWPDQETIAKQWQADRRFTPAIDETERRRGMPLVAGSGTRP